MNVVSLCAHRPNNIYAHISKRAHIQRDRGQRNIIHTIKGTICGTFDTQHKRMHDNYFHFRGWQKVVLCFSVYLEYIYTQMYTQIFNLNKCETSYFTTHTHTSQYNAYNVYAYNTKFQVEKLLVKHLIVCTVHNIQYYILSFEMCAD